MTYRPPSPFSGRFWREKCVEPVKRNKGNGLQWIVHRFPIKGGISLRDAVVRDMSRPNLFITALLSDAPNVKIGTTLRIRYPT